MRLEAVARGRGIRAKAKLTMIRLFSGAPAVDVVKTLEFGRRSSAHRSTR